MATKSECKIVKIPKGGGKFRTIYMPNRNLKCRQKNLVGQIEELALKACPPDVVHGFWPARSCVSNAHEHVGYQYTVCMDLKDFFDSCTADLFGLAVGSLPRSFEDCFVDGVARQGLPSSPAVSNICAARMDHAILARWPGVKYTRYADDLTLSCNSLEEAQAIMRDLPGIAKVHGFEVNARKTRLQWAGAGRRIITGVAVDDKGAYPTRLTRRRLRAARHKAAKSGKHHYVHRAAGLGEWAKCKPPGIGKKARKAVDDSPRDAVTIAANAARFR
jgi:hypothetical protein